MMRDKWKMATAIAVSAIFFLFLKIFVTCNPMGIKMKNEYIGELENANENSKYENKKEVENTCRSMIASYEADRLTYEQYKDSEDKEKRSWAEQAKMRANQTASSYNNFILKNSFIFEENVPKDIKENLKVIERETDGGGRDR